MIRRLAPDQENRIGSLFVNPGGPGGSGLDFVKDAPGAAFDLFSRFDIVSWDTRGDGASRPVIDCTTDAQDEAARLEGLVRPATADRAELVAAARAFTRGCEKGANGLLPHMSTADTARDLDLMRAAVGDEKLTYIGLSYGTLIGATYSSLFPERVRAMVADSPVDPDGKVNRPRSNKREQAVANEFGYRRFFAACAAAGDRCGFGGADPQQAFDDLIARANKTPIPAPNAPLPTRVTGDDILIALVDLVIAKSTWPLMAAALASAEAGDASTIRQLYDAQIGPAKTAPGTRREPTSPRPPPTGTHRTMSAATSPRAGTLHARAAHVVRRARLQRHRLHDLSRSAARLFPRTFPASRIRGACTRDREHPRRAHPLHLGQAVCRSARQHPSTHLRRRPARRIGRLQHVRLHARDQLRDRSRASGSGFDLHPGVPGLPLSGGPVETDAAVAPPVGPVSIPAAPEGRSMNPLNEIRLVPLTEVAPDVLGKLLEKHPAAWPGTTRGTADEAHEWLRRDVEAHAAEHDLGPWAIFVDGDFAGWGGFHGESGNEVVLVLEPIHWPLGDTIARHMVPRQMAPYGFLEIAVALRTPGMWLGQRRTAPDPGLDGMSSAPTPTPRSA